MDVRRREPKPNPISKANFISKLFLAWFWPIFRLGYQCNLKTVKDLWEPAPEEQAEVNVAKLERAWFRHLGDRVLVQDFEKVQFLPNNNVPPDEPNKKKDKKENYDYKLLARALLDAFGTKYFLVWPFMILIDCGLKVIQPWFMLLLVRTFIEEPRDETAQYLYAAGVCVTTFLITLTSNPCLFHLGRMSQRCRIALASLLQRKVLRLSGSNQRTNLGQISTLISNDTSVIETNLPELPYIVVAPLQLIIFLLFLYPEFGLSSLAGTCFVLVYMPFQYKYGTWSAKFRELIGKKTDERTRLLTEVIDAIQTVKLYAWELVFQNLLKQRRTDEVKQIRSRSRLHAFQMAVFLTSSRFVPFLTFVAFLFLGGPLTADRVFYGIAVFNVMTHYMVFLLPGAIRGLGEIMGSLGRLQMCLQLPEKPSNENSYLVDSSSLRVTANDVSSSWHSNKDRQNEQVLTNFSCQLEGNKLVVVVGRIGSGKTSLLNLILNEQHITSGNLVIGGTLSYSPQEPNLFPGSIRANIINSDEYDDQRYLEVLNAACLKNDIEEFEKGDSTEVTQLSGGQKARVNLARALYHKASIYLLDDPLSAVDAGVSQSIFENAVQRFLGNTLRILVTHHLQYLDKADHVILLNEGTIVEQGHYSDENVKSAITLHLGQQADVSVDALMANNAVSSSSVTANGTIAKSQETGVTVDDEDDLEKQGEGALGLKIYWKYFNAGKSLSQLLTYFFIFVIAQVFTTLIEFWLALWTNAEEKLYEASLHTSHEFTTSASVNDTEVKTDDTFTWQGFENFLSNLDNLEQNYYLYIYLTLTTIVLMTNLAKAAAFFHYCIRISANIHQKMLQRLLLAQPSFFDKNPSGRIMNRFTKDISVIDEQIPYQFFNMWTIFLQVVTVIILLIFAIWYSIVPIFMFLLALGYVRKCYVLTSRELKRIDGSTRSPVLSHIQATFNSVVTMRALGAGSLLSKQFDILQDDNTSTTVSFLAATQCFNIWIETLATLLLTFVAFGFLIAQNYFAMNFLGGNVGLAICSAMSLTIWLQYGMKVSAQVENFMISVERALEYTKLDSEAPLENSTATIPNGWPSTGKITFEDVSLSYDKGKTMTLKSLSFHVTPCEKVGIVGKTGAGKSSVLRALSRMTELNEGKIWVDEVDISLLGLHDLRRSIVIIPQEPKLFKGSLEFNLDPRPTLENNKSRAKQMETILTEVGLNKPISFEVDNKGQNLSFGQRQLVSIARALLMKGKMLCLDEATAHIDQRTDQQIQNILRNTLKDSTAITIAHRLGTVIESDRILVLHEGEKKEYDHPYTLLQKPEAEGWLKSMVAKTDSAGELEDRALQSWRSRAGHGSP